MFQPSLEDVQRLAPSYTLIPVRTTLLADQETPIRLYQKFRSDDSFLLESVEGGARWARFSFIGLRPFLKIEAKDDQISIYGRDGMREQCQGNPVWKLREYMDRYKSPSLPQFPRLTGGAVGFFGYNTLRYFEELPAHREEHLQVPDLRFLFVDELLVFDHLKQEIQLIVNLHIDKDDTPDLIARKYDQACDRLQQLAAQAAGDLPARETGKQADVAERRTRQEMVPNMPRSRYEEIVRRAKEYIAAGDIFQVVLSQRFSVETTVDPFAVYRVLRTLNPSPYMYYLQYENETLVGASPELLVRVEDGKVEMRPIAGTRKRGATAEEDVAMAEELLADPKERAEHYMLLDLGRNDVGRVSSYGSVNVDEQMVIEQYSHVMHLVSHVSGQLRADLHPFDALLSAFPAGTVSGAPKLRAMEIIAELEPDARHTYAGAIGYLSFTGNLDSCITIRTILFKENQAYIQAGAGIVADSVPELEYRETINKAAALMQALEKAEQLFSQAEVKA
ncbi:anthranilate synthase component I [Brevibacillus humidisoli]|uniref:anthranilate synthase component I n=1 Tax=Brevibacillus humidisoli TaxID=2895522 RepID=UPI001E5E34A9|nr:anthranilate synthase component I [Brevibacillus humidisoli]UFJ42775.1 anthranilate synthase component I [Brevibacillus humidisoli]